MALPFYNWSRTAASNATADATVNWQEGQAPSSVNDSARAMMASTAAYRDDIAGAITTGGTATAYTLTSYEIFDSLAHMDGKVIAFTPHATNTAGSPNVTLNVDGLGAKSIQVNVGVELPAGVLILGSPYAALYNAANGVWLLQSFYGNPYSVMIGGIMPFAGSTAPNSSFVLPYGQAISRTTYATLFGITGTTYGTGDGSTTFNVPDLRGRVAAGKDDMGGSAASRLTSSYFGGTATTLGAVGGGEYHVLTVGELPSHYHDAVISDPGHHHDYNASNNNQASATGGGALGLAIATNNTITSTEFTNAHVSSANGTDKTGSTGTGAAHAIVQPTIVLNYLLRVI